MAELMTKFTNFFRAVHGYDPFEWQKCFARKVLEDGDWPAVIRVPTGCGKTSVLDVAVFELVLQAERDPQQRTAARRICFVVDRRLVVDEAAEHGRSIQRAIMAAVAGERDEPELKQVAEQLARLAVDPAKPLRVVRLRGSVYRDDGWAADPLTPTILVSTVDQIGSRLLFRGYGVRPRSRPVHAGLLFFDTRIILDEAHLSTVFAETIGRIQMYQQKAEQSPLPGISHVSVVCVSATAGEGRPVFELTEPMREDKRLKPRLEAGKQAHLFEVKVTSISKEMQDKQKSKARSLELENQQKFALRVVQEAKALVELKKSDVTDHDNSPRVVGIVVNRVATARQVFEHFHQKSENELECDAILLTGRIRPYDRDRLLETWLPKMKAGRENEPDRPLFVVATQTVEVGANIDFDALVTEAAPLDALRQRFGRLDRLGRRHERGAVSPAVILIRSDRKSKKYYDPIYGTAIAATWEWLNKTEGYRKRKFIDFGSNLLDSMLKDLEPKQIREMIAPQRVTPLLFPAHLDAWAKTNPGPDIDPDVAPFLHGQNGSTADVQVVWRADMGGENLDEWADIIGMTPPRTREALPIPVYEFWAWLQRQATGEVADVEGTKLDVEVYPKIDGFKVLQWRGVKDVRIVAHGEVRPGDTIVVPANYGGADKYGWKPSSTVPVKDVAEACLAQFIASYPPSAFRRPTLRFRLHQSLLDTYVAERLIKDNLNSLLSNILLVAKEGEEDLWPLIRRLLSNFKDHVDDSAHRTAMEALLKATKRRFQIYPQYDGLVISASVPISLPEGLEATSEDAEDEEVEDNEASLVPAGREVLLQEHISGIKEMIARFVLHCGLSDDLRKALNLAGEWHDEGKRDRRFQAWLHGSELKALAMLAAGQILAKSGRDAQDSRRFGYPRGARHEFVSVRLFDKANEGNGDRSVHDLARLLIGTHHGYGRPFAPPLPKREELRPVEVAGSYEGRLVTVTSDHGLYRLDSGWTDLFWKMVRCYGWWGLSFLEALLVTADHLVSAREQRQSANQIMGPAI
jgi:CRISPR-associated endonuclease/helicase Cas3